MEINSNWFSRHHHPKCHACVVLMFAFEGTIQAGEKKHGTREDFPKHGW